jgi:tetrahydromethanopterin S-methyltransferase subunit F
MKELAQSLSTLSCRDLSLIFSGINTVIIVGIVMGMVTIKNTKIYKAKILGYSVVTIFGLLLASVVVLFLNVLSFHGSMQ